MATKKDFKTVRTRNGIYSVFEVKGLDAIEKDLLRMEREVRTDKGRAAAKAAMMPVKQDVLKNIGTSPALIDTGALRASVRQVVANDKRGIRSDVRAGVDRRGTYVRSGRRTPAYALQLEYDAQGRDERTFMRPAFDGKEVELAERLRRLLANTVLRWKTKQRG